MKKFDIIKFAAIAAAIILLLKSVGKTTIRFGLSGNEKGAKEGTIFGKGDVTKIEIPPAGTPPIMRGITVPKSMPTGRVIGDGPDVPNLSNTEKWEMRDKG